MHKLEFRDVTLRYDDGRHGADGLLAVENLSLAVEAGESLAIIGPSGCGKSSTLQMAAGLVRPSSGEVFIDGQLITKPRQKTALILQDFGLLPWKTVLANAELGLKVRGVDRERREAKAREALDLVGLADFAHAYPGELSGGMQQRVQIAKALSNNPPILLLDEVTTGLDLSVQAAVLDLIQQIMDEPLSALDALLREQLQDTLLELWHKEGYAQLLVTHSIDEAVYLGRRIVVLSARPGHVVGVLDNPAMGQVAYRGSSAYYELCNEIRALLRDASHVHEDEGGCHA